MKNGGQEDGMARGMGRGERVAWVSIVVALLVVGCVNISPERTSKMSDDIFYIGNLSFSKTPLLNQTTDFTFSVTPLAYAPNTSIQILLPEGIQIVSGNLLWEGDIEQRKTVNQTILIRITRPGNWKVEGIVKSILPDDNVVHSNYTIYVSTSEEKSIVSTSIPQESSYTSSYEKSN